MQNITPEDRKKWDKAIRRHERRLKRTPTKVLVQIILVVFLIGCVGVLYTIHQNNDPALTSPETILNDTLQIEQGDISRDSAIEEMKKTPAGREYDSLVKGRAEHE